MEQVAVILNKNLLILILIYPQLVDCPWFPRSRTSWLDSMNQTKSFSCQLPFRDPFSQSVTSQEQYLANILPTKRINVNQYKQNEENRSFSSPLLLVYQDKRNLKIVIFKALAVLVLPLILPRNRQRPISREICYACLTRVDDNELCSLDLRSRRRSVALGQGI